MQRMRVSCWAKVFWAIVVAVSVFYIYRMTAITVSTSRFLSTDDFIHDEFEDHDDEHDDHQHLKFRPGTITPLVKTSKDSEEEVLEVAAHKAGQIIDTYYDTSTSNSDNFTGTLGSKKAEDEDEKQLWRLLQKEKKGTLNMLEATGEQERAFPNPSSSNEFSVEEACPNEFRIADVEASWFQMTVVQRSQKPKENSLNFTNDDDVLILTPVSDAKKTLRRYFENLCSLTYPHKRISIILGEDSSGDGTFEVAESFAKQLRGHFRRVEVVKLSGRLTKRIGNFRHDPHWQLERRRHLAMARNQLISRGLQSEKYVLWIDSDVRHIPTDLLEHLIFPRKQIIVPHCLYRKGDGTTDTFDRNTWRETDSSIKFLQGVPKDFLMLEGYAQTKRLFLSDLKTESDLVRIDGVGGCILLVEADLHRKGLVFPPFVFDHHIETEGMAKMAAQMGATMFGLPSVNIIHW